MDDWSLQMGACSPVNGQLLFSLLPGGRAGMEEGLRNSPPCSAQSGGRGAQATGGPELGGTPEPQGAAQPEIRVSSRRGPLYGRFRPDSAISWLSPSGPLSWVRFYHPHNMRHTSVASSACQTPFPASFLLLRFLLLRSLSPHRLPKAMEKAER